jgi:hypothetical protein
MPGDTNHTGIEADFEESLVSAARTSLGDTLRSVVYFTPSAFDVLYVRRGLYPSTEAARDAKSQLVALETVGFAEAPARTAIFDAAHESSIGPYEFTVRFHEDGFVVRVLEGDAGVLLTTDAMDVTAFETAAIAIRKLLAGE